MTWAVTKWLSKAVQSETIEHPRIQLFLSWMENLTEFASLPVFMHLTPAAPKLQEAPGLSGHAGPGQERGRQAAGSPEARRLAAFPERRLTGNRLACANKRTTVGRRAQRGALEEELKINPRSGVCRQCLGPGQPS